MGRIQTPEITSDTKMMFPAGSDPNTDLGPCSQQELDTLRLPSQARLVQRGDRVIGDRIDTGSALYQLLQLQDFSPPGCFMHWCSISPEA